ncbi:MAG: EF-P 5-aminopentanol modification-associated protein YfmH [Faecousia sp.]
MTEFQYPELDEQLYQEVLPGGLTVAVVPRKGFARSIAYFVTDFGSIHTDFRLEGVNYTTPAGVAHYLEHKMFELPGNRDVAAEFAALGASVNAFTSYDMTAYYFSCTQAFGDCLRLLLEFVSTPYFTQESVDRERGIIDQEIGMNLDAPDSVIFDRLMAILYENHPIRVPILGTGESIREITPEILELCHRAFYHPGNMLLCVIGDVDPEAVKRIALEVLGTQVRPMGEKCTHWPEAMTPVEAETVCAMEVAMPTFSLAFKCEPIGLGSEAIRREMVADLAAEALFGESSELYLQLYEQGLIDSSFGGGFETVQGCAMLCASGDSDDPRAVRDAILAQAEKLVEEGIGQEEFLRLKRSALGRRIRGLDSLDGTCFRICAYHFSDFDYFRFPEVYRGIEKQEILEFLARVVRRERCAISIINPLAQAGDEGAIV